MLETAGAVISDGNAASDITRFYPAEEGLRSLNFDLVYATWWNADNPIEKDERKRVKYAEALIPSCVPYRFVTGAVVASGSTRDRLRSKGFQGHIIIDPDTFFMDGGE